MNSENKLLGAETLIKVKFTQNVDLDIPEDIKIEKNKKITLPIFLAQFFIENGYCSYSELLNKNIMKEFNAKASSVNLQNKFFYSSILLLKEKNDRIADIFLERMKDYIDILLAKNVNDDEYSGMDHIEYEIIKEAKENFDLFL